MPRSSALDRTFAALADPTRRGVVELLRAKPRRASDLASAMRATRPAMSRHLGVLRRAGLVAESSEEADARARTYRLLRGPFRDLRAWAADVEALWTEQLGAFKTFAERRGD